MRVWISTLLASLVLVSGPAGMADVLELKNGTILNGKYMGGTAATLRFEALGSMQVIETSRIIALTFTTQVSPSKPATTPPTGKAAPGTVSKPGATVPPRTLTVPAGTMLLVRLMDSVSSRNRPGTHFATKLEYDLVVGDAVVLKGGTKIYGRVKSSTQARRVRGRSTLDIRLTQIQIAGKSVPITTNGYKVAGEASIKKAARGAAAGAIIGGVVDGSKGAGKGAAIGATVGELRKGQTITITPGTLLEFNLAQLVKLSS